MALILITGASRGIGLELACQYAEAGDTVIASCRDPESANALRHLAQSHPSVEVQDLDVVDQLSVLSLASLVSKRSEKIDVLINNAGIRVMESPDELSADAFSATFETNAVAPALIMQAFSKVMSEGGKMINLSSALGSFELGLDLGGANTSYAASKAALNMIIRHMAPSLKEKGIVAVGISPGWVKTDMGGQEAPLSLEESVSSLLPLIAALGLEDSGKFIDHEGQPIPW